MATSNRDRIDRGMTILAAGLTPFVDATMSAAAPAGRDWVEVLEARDSSRHGTGHHYSRDDARFFAPSTHGGVASVQEPAFPGRAELRQ